MTFSMTQARNWNSSEWEIKI